MGKQKEEMLSHVRFKKMLTFTTSDVDRMDVVVHNQNVRQGRGTHIREDAFLEV